MPLEPFTHLSQVREFQFEPQSPNQKKISLRKKWGSADSKEYLKVCKTHILHTFCSKSALWHFWAHFLKSAEPTFCADYYFLDLGSVARTEISNHRINSTCANSVCSFTRRGSEKSLSGEILWFLGSCAMFWFFLRM